MFRTAILITTCCLSLAASNAGKSWGVERASYTDPVTGLKIWEITAPGSASDNFYYHVSNFTADDRYLIFLSNRTGSQQLFRMAMDSGEIVQLTDDPAIAAASVCPDRKNPRIAYVMRGADVMRLDIVDFSLHRVATIPPPHNGGFGQPSQSGDGRYLAVTKRRDAANWEVGLIDIETGAYRTVVTQGFPIGHVQHSPTDPLIFYVWETGGYAPQRTWIVNRDGTGNRPLYAAGKDEKSWVSPLKEWVTHESFVAATGEMTMVVDKLGLLLVKPDGAARIVREGSYWHCHARDDGRYIATDDQKGRIWLLDPRTGNIKLLATGIRATVPVHAHMSFDHSGRWGQFHTGRHHETLALIDLEGVTP